MIPINEALLLLVCIYGLGIGSLCGLLAVLVTAISYIDYLENLREG